MSCRTRSISAASASVTTFPFVILEGWKSSWLPSSLSSPVTLNQICIVTSLRSLAVFKQFERAKKVGKRQSRVKPPCAFTLKLLKLLSYTGYRVSVYEGK